MKHNHNADANVNLSVDIPKQDVIDVIDKITDSAKTIIVFVTIAQIVKFRFTR